MEIPSQRPIATHYLIMNSALSRKSHIFPPFMPQILSEGMFQRRAAKDPVILTLKRILWSFSEICFSDGQVTFALDLTFVGGGGEEAPGD